ncbi:DUF7282 domain-containing protein [Limimaricola hongkongensis]|uniref:DUF7282 domain-containing protein n=1 Tax=Limimaricola hongkongensis DSM 17492 TaxID=1122180 RepID=A0A017H8W7_9RHOB|nr:hypothetical protein [Limimaricola hongkongensis]EYD70826.1 hypothetical protein Lokhon_02468 [Limimaricola hongkongensis DSM 17492]
MLKSFTTAAALTALMAGGAMAQDEMMIDADDTAMRMAVAEGQTTVTFPRIATRQNGYIVLHEVADGAPVVPESIGHAMVMAGENTDVTVTIPEALPAGTELVAMLHTESNGNGIYDFGPGMTDVDTPVLANGAPVTAMFTVPEGLMVQTAEATSPAVADPEARAESDDDDDPDYRDDNEDPIQPNDLDTEGFLEEGEDTGGAGDEDDGQ